MPEISVIVPVYNTEKFLPRCIDSLLRQTYTDFEILLIDDGSADNSALICRAYSLRDNRVRFFQSEHSGVCALRNLGLERAAGKFIMFCESDDYVEPVWMERLRFYACQYPDSLVNCDYADSVPAKKYMKVKTLTDASRSQLVDKAHFFPMSMQGMTLHLWTRIFRTDIIRMNRLTFRENMHQWEDIVFIAEYLRFCDGIFYVKECLYYWVDNLVGSLSRSYFPYCFEDLKEIYEARKPLIDDRYIQAFYDDAFNRFVKSINIVWDERNTDSRREKLGYCKKVLDDPSFRETFRRASERACPRTLRTKIIRLYRLAEKTNDKK